MYALEIGIDFRAVFADVGNEHDMTYDFIRNLPARTGGPDIQIVRADLSDKFEARRERIRQDWPKEGVEDWVIERACDSLKPTGNPFLDICQLRGGFPSSQRRFCTEELKIRPIHEHVYKSIWDAIVGLASKKRIPLATFYAGKRIGVAGKITSQTHGIRAAAEWSRTSRGGKQFDMDFEMAETFGPCVNMGVCE